MISIAESNAELAPQVKDILRRKFAKKELTFIDPYRTGEVGNSVQELYGVIYIRHFETASKVFKNYGNLVQKVSLWLRDPLSEMSHSIYKFVNLYSSESLERIEIIAEKQPYSLSEYTKPFKNVEYVFLGGRFSDFGSSVLNFGKLFPKMHRLILDGIECKELSWATQTYPYLESLSVEIGKSYETPDRITNALVEQLVTKNPQIHDLSLKYPSSHLLKVVATTLMDLKTLKIKRYIESKEDVETGFHFKNVKSLKFMHGSQSAPANVTFDKLEKFTTDAKPSTCFRWIELIEKTKTLRKLNVYRDLSNDDFKHLSQAKSELIKAFVMLDDDIKGENILKFLENNQKLEKVVFRLGLGSVTPIEKFLREQVGKDWYITVESTKTYFLYMYRIKH